MNQKLIQKLKAFPISLGGIILLGPMIIILPLWFTNIDPAGFAFFFGFVFVPLFILLFGSIHEIEKSARFISLIVLIAFIGTALNYLGWGLSSGELATPDYMTVSIIKFEFLIQALAGAVAFIIQGVKIFWRNYLSEAKL